MKTNKLICIAFFLVLFSCIFITDCFNIKLTPTKHINHKKEKQYNYFSFGNTLKLNRYTVEGLQAQSLSDLEKKCSKCVKTPPPKPPKPPQPKKCCNKPVTACNVSQMNNSGNTKGSGKLCCGTGSCIHWCGGSAPAKLSFNDLAKVWNETGKNNKCIGACASNKCESALYNAHKNSGEGNNVNNVPVGNSDGGIGMWKLPSKAVAKSSPSSSCQQSVLNDPCKQAYIQQKRLGKNCKDSNWKDYKTHDPSLASNPDFQKGLHTCQKD